MNDTKLLIDILGAGFEIYLIILLFQSLWERSATKKWIFNVNIIAIAILYVISIVLFQNAIILPLIAFGIKIYLSFFYKSSIQSKLLFSIISFSISAFAEIITGITLSQITNLSIQETQTNMLAYFMGVFVSKIIVLIIIKAIKYFRKGNKRISNKFAITMIFSPLYSLILAFIIYVLAYDSSNMFVTILSEISTIILVVANIFIFNIIENQAESELVKQRFELSQQQLKSQIEHYTDLYNAQRETRKIQHDMKNNLIAITGLLNKNLLKDAQDYINKLTGEIENTTAIVDTGFPTIDAILSAKIQQAAELNITINYKIIVDDEIIVDTMDLATLLANALDNAIEGSCGNENEKKSVITLNIYNTSEYLAINLENSTNNKIDTKIMNTNKPDIQNHGFGLQQIKAITTKYQGSTDIEFDAETKKFRLLLLIKNMKI
jgi:two-component system sensor histidine kinase AgrC